MSPRPRWHRWATTALSLVPAAVVIALGYHRRWITDDALITLRVVEHLLAGHGPVYNVDERIEAVTHPLWAALIAAIGALGVPLEAAALALGIGCSAVGVVAAQAAAVRLCQSPSAEDSSRAILPLGLVVFLAVAVVWDFVTSGLETGLIFLWVGASYWLLSLVSGAARSRSLVCWTAVAIGLGPLVRPDLAVMSGVFLLTLVALVGPRPGVLAAAIVPGLYQVFRMGWFGAITPNTALAKEAGVAHWRQGLHYAADFVATYHLWVPAFALAAWLALDTWHWRESGRRTTLLRLAPLMAAFLHAAFVTRVGGDFMHGRFLLPSFFAALLPVAVVLIDMRPRPRAASGHVRWALAALTLVWAASCALWLRSPHTRMWSEVGIADERSFYVNVSGHPNPTALTAYVDLPPARTTLRQVGASRARGRHLYTATGEYPLGELADRRVAAVIVPVANLGIAGLIAGLNVHVVDRMGLADPLASRLRLARRGRPGHEKGLGEEWVRARYAAPAADSSETVIAARAALTCGMLRELIDAVEQPMSLDRFIRNVRRSVALTQLRIPPDPLEARRVFCGR